jgi:DNA-binding MarR family transcriptional regulator
MAKLTEADVRVLRGLYRDGGWSAGRLAERYRVSVSTIYRITKGQTRPRVEGPKSARDNRAKLTRRDVLELRRLYRGDEWTVQRLAERYGISRSAVCAAARGVSWSHVEEPAPVMMCSEKINNCA